MKVTITVIHLYSPIYFVTDISWHYRTIAFYNLKQTNKKSIQEAKSRTGHFISLGPILSSVAADFRQLPNTRKPKTAGIISAGLSLLVTGLYC
jgi:hypothetical protein